MSQFDILEIIEQAKGKWITTNQIAKKMKRTKGSIRTIVGKVKTFDHIQYKMKRTGNTHIGAFKLKSKSKSSVF